MGASATGDPAGEATGEPDASGEACGEAAGDAAGDAAADGSGVFVGVWVTTGRWVGVGSSSPPPPQAANSRTNATAIGAITRGRKDLAEINATAPRSVGYLASLRITIAQDGLSHRQDWAIAPNPAPHVPVQVKLTEGHTRYVRMAPLWRQQDRPPRDVSMTGLTGLMHGGQGGHDR
jgi:hypothetical protein